VTEREKRDKRSEGTGLVEQHRLDTSLMSLKGKREKTLEKRINAEHRCRPESGVV